MRFRCLLAAAAVPAVLSASAVAAQDHRHGGDPATIGRVTFPTSCAPAVQGEFERAVAMLHSFWFEEAEAAFSRVAAQDPRCAMAHWGIAMTLLGNPFTGQAPPAPRLAAALAAADRAVELARATTARERGWAAAVRDLYADPQRLSHPERMSAHEAAMRRLTEQSPDDEEAAIFLARAMVANAPPLDLEFERQRQAAAMLEPLFRRHPQHPGLAHYIIHAYDSPRLASAGLDAARRYAEIAPSAPHALHMPSHIFTRLGYWDESIETNRRSAAAEPDSNAAVHPMDYMVYAFLQQGRDREAERVVGRAIQNPDRFYGGIIGYNFAAMPARLALERGRWNDAARLPVPGGALPFIVAMTHFGRGIGAARGGDHAAARLEHAALEGLRDTLEARGEAYWRTIVEAQRLAVASWIARAEGNDSAAVRLARAAADLEETVEKHPVTPGPLLPARELEGDMLLELDRPAEALRAYERNLEREPNRARTLYGSARAAQRAGEKEIARARYAQLLELMRRADPARAELAAARAYLASSGG